MQRIGLALACALLASCAARAPELPESSTQTAAATADNSGIEPVVVAVASQAGAAAPDPEPSCQREARLGSRIVRNVCRSAPPPAQAEMEERIVQSDLDYIREQTMIRDTIQQQQEAQRAQALRQATLQRSPQ